MRIRLPEPQLPSPTRKLSREFLSAFGMPALLTTPSKLALAAADFSGHRNVGSLNGGVTVVPSGGGTLGAAWQFDGSSGYLNFGSSLSVGSGDFSFGCGFVSHQPTTQDASLFAKSLYGQAVGRYFLLVNDAGTNTLSAGVAATGGSGIEATAPSSYADGRWHVAVAVVRRKQSLTLYVDGDVAASASLSIDQGENWNTSYDLLLGAYNDSSGGASPAQLFFQGAIPAAFLWRQTLSASQVAALYRSLVYGDPPLFRSHAIELPFGVAPPATSRLLLERRRLAA